MKMYPKIPQHKILPKPEVSRKNVKTGLLALEQTFKLDKFVEIVPAHSFRPHKNPSTKPEVEKETSKTHTLAYMSNACSWNRHFASK